MAPVSSRDAVVGSLQGDTRGSERISGIAGEKRDSERVPVPGELRGEVMVFQPMRVLDISLGGAKIETAFALQLGSLHDFRLSLGGRSVVVKGRIAYCQIGELTDTAALYRIGVGFVEVADHAAHVIADFVIATQHARGGLPVSDATMPREEDAHR